MSVDTRSDTQTAAEHTECSVSHKFDPTLARMGLTDLVKSLWVQTQAGQQHTDQLWMVCIIHQSGINLKTRRAVIRKLFGFLRRYSEG